MDKPTGYTEKSNIDSFISKQNILEYPSEIFVCRDIKG
jgi:hypothetical protein